MDREAEPEILPKVLLPLQPEFFKVPHRFGSVPVDELPLGCDKDKQYYLKYPRVNLPFQRVERISYGHPKLEPNRLFWGDNLHVMRLLPSESIDLIYIDPPFFSGRQYNVIFGDRNEVASFTDIWEGGMPGYLVWLNARLIEMKRLLKRTGSIYVHLDYHASHYVKVELDKIFGYDNFRNEIVWQRNTSHNDGKKFGCVHDTLLLYTKGDDYFYNRIETLRSEEEREKRFGQYDPVTGKRYTLDNLAAAGQGPARQFGDKLIHPPIGNHWRYRQEKIDELLKEGRIVFTGKGTPRFKRYEDDTEGRPVQDVWVDFYGVSSQSGERIGYPTQKPQQLLQRIMLASSRPKDLVADFFCGGGTTPAVAQREGRRWIACDISRVAVTITLDRITKLVNAEKGPERLVQHSLAPSPDAVVDYFGFYEVPALTRMHQNDFERFIIQAYDGRLGTGEGMIHGYKQGIPIHVGPVSQTAQVTKNEVVAFAEEITTRRGKREGIMLAWAFAPSAQQAAQRLLADEAVSVDFVRLQLIPIESDEFKEHVISQHREYANLVSFILPPAVRLRYKRTGPLVYEFDISESTTLNAASKIINVQWDFDFEQVFTSTAGYSYMRNDKNQPVLRTRYEFSSGGFRKIACKIQDDLGGEKMHIEDMDVR